MRKTGSVAMTMLAAAAFLAAHSAALAQNGMSASGASSARGDPQASQPSLGTGLTARGIAWSGDPVRAAPYWGVRYTRFFDAYPNWGVSLDYPRYGMAAGAGRPASFGGSGLKESQAAGFADLDQFGPRLDTSPGLNSGSVNAVYRWLNPSFAGGRLQPYVGAGLSYYWPRSDNLIGPPPRESALQASGYGYQLMGGLQYRLSDRWGAFAEARFDNGSARTDITSGRSDTDLRSFRAMFGLHYGF